MSRLTNHIFGPILDVAAESNSTLDKRATFFSNLTINEPHFFTWLSINEPHFWVGSQGGRSFTPKMTTRVVKRSVEETNHSITEPQFFTPRSRLTRHDSLIHSINEPQELDQRATDSSRGNDSRATKARLTDHRNLGNLAKSKLIQLYNSLTNCSYKRTKQSALLLWSF
jgi:hypothetical protein